MNDLIITRWFLLMVFGMTGAIANQTDGRVVGHYYQTMDSINNTVNPNDADAQINKGFGSGTYHLFLGASGANATSSTLNYNYFPGGCLVKSGGDHADGDFDLNLQIPDGHELLGFRFYYHDQVTQENVDAQLWKFDGAGGSTLIAAVSSDGSAGTGNVWSGDIHHIIDNSTGAYVMRFNLNANGSTSRVCGARLLIDSNPTP